MPLSSPSPGYARPANSFSNPVSGNLLDPAAAIATWADYDAAIDTLAKKAARGDISQTLSNTEKVQALANIGGIGLAVGAITSVASASTVDLGAQATFRVLITGTTAITSFGTVADQYRQVRFAGALTLTHNATTLILPGGANIVTAAGDVALCTSDGSGNWRVVAYMKADASPLVGAETSVASAATVDLGAQPTWQVLITGTTTITSFGTVARYRRLVRFGGALTLTHNATTLILPGGVNITTAAGDIADVVSDGSGNARVLSYQRADGTPVIGWHAGNFGRPQSAGGIGQWFTSNFADNTAAVLPAGGTWAYFLILGLTGGSMATANLSSGVAAGGATIAGAIAGARWSLFAWRVQ